MQLRARQIADQLSQEDGPGSAVRVLEILANSPDE